jgi:hypothetical protein
VSWKNLGNNRENAWRFSDERPIFPFNLCSILFQLRSSGKFRPKSKFGVRYNPTYSLKSSSRFFLDRL